MRFLLLFLMRKLYWIGFVLFAAFAALQVNDTNPEIYEHASVIDAWLWVAFYALVAVCFLLKALGKLPKWLLIIAVVACLLEMGDTVRGVIANASREEGFDMAQTSMSAESPEVELSREFFGAVIGLAGLVVLWRGKSY